MTSSEHRQNGTIIYGIEEAEGTRALVLDLVEGPTLADRIAQGAISGDEALPIAKQIAEALEAAHEAGVIHRDLKPANIKVRDDGMPHEGRTNDWHPRARLPSWPGALSAPPRGRRYDCNLITCRLDAKRSCERSPDTPPKVSPGAYRPSPPGIKRRRA